MNKYLLGSLFVVAGLAYGSLAFDVVYQKTLGFLIENGWIKPPAAEKVSTEMLGRRPTILMYSIALIVIGIFILWKL